MQSQTLSAALSGFSRELRSKTGKSARKNKSKAMAEEDERIFSIMLSASELATLDLSSLRLFPSLHALNSSSCRSVVLKSTKALLAEEQSYRLSKRKEAKKQKVVTCRDASWEDSASVRIDLASSPASRFLVQGKVWDLQSSPVNGMTPPAVAFKWEESPGKLKSALNSHRTEPSLLPLNLPPRLLRKQASNLHSSSSSFSSSSSGLHSRCSSDCDEKQVISYTKLPSLKFRDDEEEADNRSPGCVISSLDFNPLGSPWNGTLPPSYSPPRSRIIAAWRRMQNNRQKIQRQKEQQSSFNVRIAAAMGIPVSSNSVNSKKCIQTKEKQYSECEEASSPVFVRRRRRRRLLLKRLRRTTSALRSFCVCAWRAVLRTRSQRLRMRRKGSRCRISYTSLIY